MSVNNARTPIDFEEWEGNHWDRQPWDSNASWSAFSVWIVLPRHERTFLRVAKGLSLASAQHIGDYSVRYHWQARTNAFDAAVDEQSIAVIASTKAAQYAPLIKTLELMDRRITECLESQDVKSWTPTQLQKFMEFTRDTRLSIFGPLVNMGSEVQSNAVKKTVFNVVVPAPEKK